MLVPPFPSRNLRQVVVYGLSLGRGLHGNGVWGMLSTVEGREKAGEGKDRGSLQWILFAKTFGLCMSTDCRVTTVVRIRRRGLSLSFQSDQESKITGRRRKSIGAVHTGSSCNTLHNVHFGEMIIPSHLAGALGGPEDDEEGEKRHTNTTTGATTTTTTTEQTGNVLGWVSG